MHRVALFSGLLIMGLITSQVVDVFGNTWIKLATMCGLAFIMIRVGFEFDIDKTRPRQYLKDYLVAGTAAAFPWAFVTLYFVLVMAPASAWLLWETWRDSLLLGRFASPTSAGVLFSMLAAAGLASTWLFRKARVLAIFDDLDTVLLMLPLKALMVGLRWQLGVIVIVIVVLLWLAWKYLHRLRIPTGWPWVLTYAVALTALCECVYLGSKRIDASVPIHLEVLLPAFVLGCMLARPASGEHAHDAHESPTEQRVSTWVSAVFMVLVGLSMPPILVNPVMPAQHGVVDEALMPQAFDAPERLSIEQAAMPDMAWGMIALHVLAVTLLSNLGKMFPLFVYRNEAGWRTRLALSIGMFPRGEVGAGVLVVSLGYGLGGPALAVAVLSLALNLLLTGVFILAVKRLMASDPDSPERRGVTA